jgi:hypothetical protein
LSGGYAAAFGSNLDARAPRGSYRLAQGHACKVWNGGVELRLWRGGRHQDFFSLFLIHSNRWFIFIRFVYQGHRFIHGIGLFYGSADDCHR